MLHLSRSRFSRLARVAFVSLVSFTVFAGDSSAQSTWGPGDPVFDKLSKYRIRRSNNFQLVYDYSTQACDPITINDGPPRAYRDNNGDVHLLLQHAGVRCSVNYFPIGEGTRRMSGPDFNSLTLDCTQPAVYGSHLNPNPAARLDKEWLTAVWTDDGINFTGFIHHEYHAFCWAPGGLSNGFLTENVCDSSVTFPGPAYFKAPRSITQVVSTNGGATFFSTMPATPVATDPYYGADQYNTNLGFEEPTNVVYNPHDGYYYMIFNYAIHHPDGVPSPILVGTTPGVGLRTCVGNIGVMRTLDVHDPTSWRAWGGEQFDATGGTPPQSGSGRFLRRVSRWLELADGDVRSP